MKTKLLVLLSIVLFASCAALMGLIGVLVQRDLIRTPQEVAAKPLTLPTFGRWMTLAESRTSYRGGTIPGPEVEFDTEQNDFWRQRIASKDKKQQDRLAILSMSGAYRSTFEFMETVSFGGNDLLDTPYRSWGTEYIYVVDNEENFISLQHVMVMFFPHGKKLVGPIVMKHWRQEWRYEPDFATFYKGHGLFERKPVSAKGKWLQVVFQVDDSPRYANLGAWEHSPSVSEWSGERSDRPLPRREYSVRSDYHMLSGTNRHIVTRAGWTHEQSNLKAVVDSESNKITDYLAREVGVNRYQRIKDFDFSEGDKYWKASQGFWSDVRDYWQRTLDENRSFVVYKQVNQTKMYEELFGYADKLYRGELNYSKKDSKSFIKGTVDSFIVLEPKLTKHTWQPSDETSEVLEASIAN